MSRPVTISASSRRLAGSRLDDGSSRIRISGSMASTVATATRRRCPNDRWWGGRPACSSMPTAARAAFTLVSSSGPRRPRLAGPKATSSATVGMNSWSSGSWKTIPTRRRISLKCSEVDRQAGHGHLAHPRQEHAVALEHQGGLARPVGAEQGHPLPPPDLEADPEQRLVPVGVGVGDAVDLEGGGVGRHGRSPQAVAATRAAAAGRDRAASHWPRLAARSWSTGIDPA